MGKANLQVRYATESDRLHWDNFASHPLQSWQWGEFRKSMGVDVVRLAAETNEKVSDAWQLTFHTIPFTPFTIGYFPKGPMPTEQICKELLKLGEKKRAIYIQLEPNVDRKTLRQTDRKTNSEILPSYCLTVSPSLLPSHHPLFTKYTFILDLTKSEEELLKVMHSKTRYNIRVAQKHGVVIKEDGSDKAFAAYLKLNEETLNRQGFYAHNKRYHENMWSILSREGIAKLWTASYEGEILSAWIIFLWKDTVYYPYGASSRNKREVMAPNLMLWEIARWAKAHGYKKFDLWGALGPNPDTNDPWYGFHRFKEGYNPELVEFLGSFDLVIHPLLYKLYCFIDNVRWMILKLKPRL